MPELKDFALCDVDWNLTPEQAVTMYLEWGNNDWRGEYPPVRSKDDVVRYFVVDSWETPPMVRLIRRSSEGAEELLSMPLPDEFLEEFRAANGSTRGVSAPMPSLRDWLKAQLGVDR
jgi:hypothetical protein